MRFLHCLLAAFALEGTVLAALFYLFWLTPYSVQVDARVNLQAALPTEVAESEEWEEIEPVTLPDEIVEELVVLEELASHTGGDDDGDTDFSVGSFERPYANTAIGLGAGAGGGRRGRGGRRSLRAGGGRGLATHRTWKRSNLPPHLSKLEVGDGDELPLASRPHPSGATGRTHPRGGHGKARRRSSRPTRI